jgi:hypothetical protein
MRSKNAQNRLQMLFRTLDTRQQLSHAQKALQILRTTGMIWILNRLKNGLEKIHSFRIQETGDGIQENRSSGDRRQDNRRQEQLPLEVLLYPVSCLNLSPEEC